jgi:multimeric flavodoxin WrbA
VGEVNADDLLSSDAVIVGSPVYFGNVAGEVKTFLDNWLPKFDFFQDFKMQNKVGGAFATGRSLTLCIRNMRDRRQRGGARGQIQKISTGKFHF